MFAFCCSWECLSSKPRGPYESQKRGEAGFGLSASYIIFGAPYFEILFIISMVQNPILISKAPKNNLRDKVVEQGRRCTL